MNNDNVTTLAIITIFIGAFSMLIKICYKSKCNRVDVCFGLLKIHRNVLIETEIESDKINTNKV